MKTLYNGRIGVRYPGGVYMPGGRDWQFRWPRALEAVLHIPVMRQWVYGHWPVEPRKPGTVG